MKSKYLTLNAKDFFRGLLIAFLTAVISGIIEMLDIGTIFTWVTIKPVLIAGVSGALAYLLKCLMTNSQDQMFKREPVTA
jgi:membrane associated rhomboid family serine protease